MSMIRKWHWSWKPRAWLNSLPQQRWRATTPHPVLAAALGRWAYDRSDIHNHLGTIFAETLRAAPRLIVELGTRGGISTLALLAAAEVADAPVLSVDIEDCAGVDIPPRFRRRWHFQLGDDVAFAGEPFERFCAARGLPPLADVIFLDTSHLYEHTRDEIDRWLPRLATGGAMIFHDTNMATWYRSLDGQVRRGWDNERGVIRAIEERLGRTYDADTYFVDIAAGFLVQHWPWCSGLTVLRRLEPRTAA
jgi:predicted O-methyltransferase YrrM